MGYLNELLSRNPLVIDGDTIRPHHNYTDDLYTGGNHKITNYDRIKSMSVEEMAVNLAKIQCDAIEQTIPIKVTEEAKKEQYELCKQWLLQEVSEDITKIEHNSLCETETYERR